MSNDIDFDRVMTEAEIHKHIDRLIADMEQPEDTLSRQEFREGHEATLTAGKEKMYSTIPKLYQLLEHRIYHIRQEAVASLGFASRLFLPEFRDRAKQIFDTDPSRAVKDTALAAWACYYDLTQDKAVLAELYSILINRQYDYDIRSTAYTAMFNVSEGPTLKYHPYSSVFLRVKSDEEFSSLILWDEMERIMRTYAPDEFEQINNPSSLRLK